MLWMAIFTYSKCITPNISRITWSPAIMMAALSPGAHLVVTAYISSNTSNSAQSRTEHSRSNWISRPYRHSIMCLFLKMVCSIVLTVSTYWVITSLFNSLIITSRVCNLHLPPSIFRPDVTVDCRALYIRSQPSIPSDLSDKASALLHSLLGFCSLK